MRNSLKMTSPLAAVAFLLTAQSPVFAASLNQNLLTCQTASDGDANRCVADQSDIYPAQEYASDWAVDYQFNCTPGSATWLQIGVTSIPTIPATHFNFGQSGTVNIPGGKGPLSIKDDYVRKTYALNFRAGCSLVVTKVTATPTLESLAAIKVEADTKSDSLNDAIDMMALANRVQTVEDLYDTSSRNLIRMLMTYVDTDLKGLGVIDGVQHFSTADRKFMNSDERRAVATAAGTLDSEWTALAFKSGQLAKYAKVLESVRAMKENKPAPFPESEVTEAVEVVKDSLVGRYKAVLTTRIADATAFLAKIAAWRDLAQADLNVATHSLDTILTNATKLANAS